MSTLSPLLSPAPAPECTSLLSPSIVNLIFSFLILFGILISYLPQHIRIVQRGTAEGISPLFVLLGVTSGTCAFLNILILSWSVLGCCSKGIGGFNCFAASLGVAQVATQWACFAVILVLFLIYLPRGGGSLGAPAVTASSATPSPKTARTITVLSIAHFVVLALVTFYIALLGSGRRTEQDSGPGSNPNSPPPPSDALVGWANSLGVQSTVLGSIQYLPQLATTWRLKHVGSLSIPMMCIQTPGSFVFAVSLAMREGTLWSSWAMYVVTGSLQGALLVMCVMWELADRRERRSKAAGSAVDANATALGEQERQPLLDDE